MKELIELIAKHLVEHKEDVQVRLIESEEGQCFELRVHPDEMGRVIGRGGRTAKAIRTVRSPDCTPSAAMTMTSTRPEVISTACPKFRNARE